MTLTPKTKQAETWTAGTQPIRVFDPEVFDNNPIFDTGATSGVWAERTKQAESWTTA